MYCYQLLRMRIGSARISRGGRDASFKCSSDGRLLPDIAQEYLVESVERNDLCWVLGRHLIVTALREKVDRTNAVRFGQVDRLTADLEGDEAGSDSVARVVH